MSEVLSGKQFKAQLREGRPKFGLFVNSHSPTVNNWRTAAMTGCWSTRSMDRWDTKPCQGCLEESKSVARYRSSVSARILIGPEFNRLWIWAPMESFARTSTTPTKPGNM